MTIINFRSYADPCAVPTLVLVDLQREYVSAPRALTLAGADCALENCRLALAHARSTGMPVAHLRRIEHSTFFHPATPFSRWIEGFEPQGADMIFERSHPSCYASKGFGEIVARADVPFILAGFSGETSCLATTIEAFHRGHPFIFLRDASASHALDDLSDHTVVHRTVSEIMALYGRVLDTRNWIGQRAKQRSLNG